MSKYETPEYQVIEQHGSIEIRKYEAFSVVKYISTEDPYAEEAFQALFRYIQGDNQSSAKMAMTVPVFQDFQEKGMTMAFVVPQKLMLSIPRPNHPSLHIDHFEAGYYAAISFSGGANASNLTKHQTELVLWLQGKGLTRCSDLIAAYYNSPFTLPFMRHNELLARIEWPTSQELT